VCVCVCVCVCVYIYIYIISCPINRLVVQIIVLGYYTLDQ